MNLQEYQARAMRSAKTMESVKMSLLHGAMGCCTEPGELALSMANAMTTSQADFNNIIEEIGDGMWFAVYTADTLGCLLAATIGNLPPLTFDGEGTTQLALRYIAAGAGVGTLVKAHAFYNKPLDDAQLMHRLAYFVQVAAALCTSMNILMETVLVANIKKLMKRYPDKYSDAAAIARADKVEEAKETVTSRAVDYASNLMQHGTQLDS